jgi:geranylgeranyl diphosphate synthase type II
MTRSAYQRHREELRRLIDRHLASIAAGGTDRNLRDACRYVLQGGGKRVRAILALLACRATGGSYRIALDAAAAIEILHNFTLVHDDIMDNADSRRGRPTVHRKWDSNTALLAGDVLIGKAYQVLLRSTQDVDGRISRLFTQGLLDVCEGQALDIALERQRRVSTAAYFQMIRKKTAALIATAAELGGLLGGATPRERAALRDFGIQLGTAFQVYDDVLDVVADSRNFGKTIGGDILERKRTFLLLRASAKATGNDARVLKRLTRGNTHRAAWKKGDGHVTAAGRRIVQEVTAVYQRTGALDDALVVVRRCTARALVSLAALRPTHARTTLSLLAEDLVERKA